MVNNRLAQHELYQRFVYMMKGVCLRYAQNEAEAEDILQEAFVQAFRNLSQYSGKGPLGAWLRKITVNKSLEQYRKTKALAQKSSTWEIKDSDSQVPDNAIEQLELNDLLEKIRQLPVGFRTVFNLYAVEGYNHKEIGELLGISEGTSKSQYSRARIMLRNMIEQEQLVDQKKLGYAE